MEIERSDVRLENVGSVLSAELLFKMTYCRLVNPEKMLKSRLAITLFDIIVKKVSDVSPEKSPFGRVVSLMFVEILSSCSDVKPVKSPIGRLVIA
jgi:hypothetical protein